MGFEKRTRKRKSQENSIINIQHGIFNFQVKNQVQDGFLQENQRFVGGSEFSHDSSKFDNNKALCYN